MTEPRLTRRQREVLELMLEGLDRRAIAIRLSLSSHTVNHLIEAVSRAHGAPTTTVLVARVLEGRLARAIGEHDECRRALKAIGEWRSDGAGR